MKPTAPLLIPLQIPGRFTLGCNYWASHAGTDMWRDWRPEVVEDDFRRLSAHGLQVLRVFVLWPDFQPITQMRGQGGKPFEIRLGEEPLPPDAVGQAGVSAIMLQRFSEFCDLAERHGLQLIVGLVTGWMSGRLYAPPALEGLDPITDSTSIAWQIKLVRTIVHHCREKHSILAWDLGNECNCMGNAPTSDAAYLWTASIANSIRAADTTRPIVSGMHTLSAPVSGVGNPWTIDDQAELTDLLTTHPYPYWVRHANHDSVDAVRTNLHATAETRFYGDIGGKPCFAEELGTMGPMVAGDDVSGGFARVNLFSLWANDCRGFLWWCAHDQTELVHAPYDWNGVETELGLLRNDGTAKPALLEIQAFGQFLDGLPFDALPPRRAEAVCIVTHNQDDWAVAYAAFVLGKQAKLEIEFRHIQQPIPDSSIYLLPSLKGANCVPRRQWLELLARVRAGATLYVSLADGIVPHFNEVAGVELLTRGKTSSPLTATFVGDASAAPFALPGGDDFNFIEKGAEVLARRTDNGQPVFWRHSLGAGQVFVFTAPIECELSHTPGSFDSGKPAYWQLYRQVAASAAERQAHVRWLNLDAPDVAVTEHPLDEDRVIVVAINHSARPQSLTGQLAARITLGTVWKGEARSLAAGELALTLPALQAAVFELSAVRRKQPAPESIRVSHPSSARHPAVPAFTVAAPVPSRA